ncbi:MAG TPA: TorF family putative porin [Steroidobacteraceae bacterium]|nr:TorF family putative porin [Steroidobacteraceae bacterium]
MDNARRCVLLLVSLLGARAASGGMALQDFGGSLALTNDDIYHGISQTCGDPAAQADLHYRSSGGQTPDEVFAGVWGSAGLGGSECGQAREANFYAGYSFATGANSSGTLTYTHYSYPGGSYTLARLAGFRYDYDAVEAQWAWLDEVYLTVAYTPDALQLEYHAFQRNRTALSYGLQLHHPLAGGLSLAAGVGYDEFADPSGTGFGFWNFGAGYALGPVELTAAYFGTATRASRLFGPYVAGNRFSVTAIWRF